MSTSGAQLDGDVKQLSQAVVYDDDDAISLATSTGGRSKASHRRSRKTKPLATNTVTKVVLSQTYRTVAFKRTLARDASAQTWSCTREVATQTTLDLESDYALRLRTRMANQRLKNVSLRGRIGELKRRLGLDSDEEFSDLSAVSEDSSSIMCSEDYRYEEEEEEEYPTESDESHDAVEANFADALSMPLD